MSDNRLDAITPPVVTAGHPSLRKQRRSSPFGQSATRSAWLYAIPALAFVAVFLFYPVYYNIDKSVSNSSSYQTLFRDPTFYTALVNSILWLVITTFVQMALGFGLAYAIQRYMSRAATALRTILFLPMAITPTVSALVFSNIYAPDYGVVFGIMNKLGHAASFPDILGSTSLASFGIMVVNIWQWLGFYVLMYAVGLLSLDQDVLAAADVDGATGLKRVRYVLLPMLKSTHWSLVILGAIQALQQFPLIYLMTKGGPDNSSQVLATYIFKKGFSENQLSYASAISVVLLVLALIVAAIQLLISRGNFSIGGDRNDPR